jgi:hypothetical protein
MCGSSQPIRTKTSTLGASFFDAGDGSCAVARRAQFPFNLSTARDQIDTDFSRHGSFEIWLQDQWSCL